MKGIMLTILLVAVSTGTVISQQTPSSSAIFIIGTSVAPDTPTGLSRLFDNTNNPLRMGPRYTFFLASAEKGFEIMFKHSNYNLTELAKERPVAEDDRYTFKIFTRSRGELATYANVVDVDQLIATKTRHEVWAWAKSIRNKEIYIIDRNDFFTENGMPKMKLIEVYVAITNQPHDPPKVNTVE